MTQHAIKGPCLPLACLASVSESCGQVSRIPPQGCARNRNRPAQLARCYITSTGRYVGMYLFVLL